MHAFGLNLLDILINVAALAIVPGILAALGGHLAAEGIADTGRSRKIKFYFWALFSFGVLVTFWQQFRLAEADQARETREVWNQAVVTRILFRPVLPPGIGYLKSSAPHPTPGPQRPLQNAPGGINIGRDNNGTAIVNNGPPPLELMPSLRVVESDRPGLIKTIVTIVPNAPVSAPTAVALEFDKPISRIEIHGIYGAAAVTSGGPFRIGVHALISVGTGFGPSHPLLIAVYSEEPVRVIEPPRLE